MREYADEIDNLHLEAATLYHQHKSDEEIVSWIVSKGHERHYAEMILENVKEDASDRVNFRKTLFYGLGFLISGIFVTFASRYFAVSVGAMFYLFFWGLIVTGISIMARAFIVFGK